MRRYALLIGLTVVILPTPASAEHPKVARVTTVVDTGLKMPFGVDFDSRGHMFIVELDGGRVHERMSDGTVKVIAGDGSKGDAGDGGPSARATFNGMHNLAISRDDKMYISDTWNHKVRVIDLKSRDIHTVYGTGKGGFSGDGGPASKATFNDIMCVSLDPAQKTLYLADLKNRRIRAIDLESGIVRTVAGNGKRGEPKDGAQATESPLVDPRAVVADADRNVYVLERNGNTLRLVKPDGTIHTIVGTGEAGYRDGPADQAMLKGPKHLCVDDQGRVIIADEVNAAIRCYDPESKTITTILGRGKGDPSITLKRPHGVTLHEGFLYVADSANHRVLKVEFAD